MKHALSIQSSVRLFLLLAALTCSTRAATTMVDVLTVTNAATIERSLTVLGTAPAYTNYTTNTVITGAITNSLVGFWPFDGNMNDYSGFANHGTNFGATQTVGRIGGAYRFNGTGSYAKIPYSTNYVFSSDFTISFWASNAAQGVSVSGVMEAGYGLANGWLFYVPSSLGRRVRFGITQNSIIYALTSDNPLDNNWHNIAAVRSGSVMSLYIDGVVQTQTTNYAGTVDIGGYYTYLGGYQAEGTFNPVAIDEYALWRRALSIEELRTIANAQPANTNVLLKAEGAQVEVLGTMKIQQLVPQGDIGMGSFTNRP